MRLGALVAKKIRWNLNSHILGIVVSQSNSEEDCWIVLWNNEGAYKLQEHLSNALIDLESLTDEALKARICTSI